jgi:hypothetical protein
MGITPEQEGELIAGFLSGKPLLEQAFLDALRPHLRRQLRGRTPDRWPDVEDVEQSAILRLCQMRRSEEGRKRLCPLLSELAAFIMKAPVARFFERARKTLPLKDWDRAQPPNQEAAYELKRLMAISVSLPRSLAATIMCQVGLVMGDGPALHEALGIDERSARRRLARAQDAVLAMAEGEEVEVSDE